MRGVGEATAAITVVNALPTGVGAAAGIGLRTRAEVRIDLSGAPALTIRPGPSDTPLARAALRAALDRADVSEPTVVELTIASEIPPGTGLKSSSAVASAVVRAVEAAAGRSSPVDQIARLAAEVSRRSGTSATGAFDDALAGLSEGVVVTDNGADRLLRAHALPRGLGVALWIPPGSHPPSPDRAARFRVPDPRAHRAVEAALAGRLWEAMQENTELVEAVMGYDYRELRARLRRRGAVAVGTSGLGPTLAVVGRTEELPALLEELPASPGERRIVGFTARSGPGGAG